MYELQGTALAFICMQENLSYNQIVTKLKTKEKIDEFVSQMMEQIRKEEEEAAEKGGYILPEEMR